MDVTMTAPAWIISITDTVSLAVGEFELIHILTDPPVLFRVPTAPIYCQQVFVWQNKIIPVMNLATRFSLDISAVSSDHVIVSIFAYRLTTGQVEYAALFLNATPRRSEVSNEQACQLPADLIAWTPYISACFQETDIKKAIPILKLERLFA
jgi:chemotaxis signal transduction protein